MGASETRQQDFKSAARPVNRGLNINSVWAYLFGHAETASVPDKVGDSGACWQVLSVVARCVAAHILRRAAAAARLLQGLTGVCFIQTQMWLACCNLVRLRSGTPLWTCVNVCHCLVCVPPLLSFRFLIDIALKMWQWARLPLGCASPEDIQLVGYEALFLLEAKMISGFVKELFVSHELTRMAVSQRHGMDTQSLGTVEGKCSSQWSIQNIYAAKPSPKVSPSRPSCPAWMEYL